MFFEITANELDAWKMSEPRRAQEILPELIIRLILATSNRITNFNFPINKGIQYSGYDGTLTADEQTNFFPKGRSVWEFGTDNDLKGKLSDDIEKRSKEPLGEDVSNTVFCFATLKIWNHKTSISEIVEEYKQKYNWKDIFVFDASKLSLWLNSCLSVSIWMAEIMGKNIDGVYSGEKYWDLIRKSSTPSLNDEFFLINREDEKRKIEEYIKSKSKCFIVVAESELEARFFILATISSLSTEENKLISRVVIIENPETWSKMRMANNSNAIFIPIFNLTNNDMLFSDALTILPLNFYSHIFKRNNGENCIQLHRYTRSDYNKALKALKYEFDNERMIEFETKRQFLPFYRLITNIPQMKSPLWVEKSNTSDLIPALLVQSWDSSFAGDREIIEELSNRKYDDYINLIGKFLKIQDSPILSSNNIFQIVSVQEMWDVLSDDISESYLENIKECVKTIFGNQDEAVTSSSENPILAFLNPNKIKYSEKLRRGLVISLIMISNIDIHRANYIDCLVKEMLPDINCSTQWDGIAEYIDLLAEASPDVIIGRIEKAAENKEESFL